MLEQPIGKKNTMNLEPVTSYLHIILDNDCNINCMMTFARTVKSGPDTLHNLIIEAMEYLLLMKENGRAAYVDIVNYRKALVESLERAFSCGNKCDISKMISVMIEADDHRAFITVCHEGNGARPVDRSCTTDDVQSGEGQGLLNELRNVEYLSDDRWITIVV
jgi:hypothetical protein